MFLMTVCIFLIYLFVPNDKIWFQSSLPETVLMAMWFGCLTGVVLLLPSSGFDFRPQTDISSFKGTVSILTPCFYGLELKKRVELSVRKSVLHFLNAAKQNYDLFKF